VSFVDSMVNIARRVVNVGRTFAQNARISRGRTRQCRSRKGGAGKVGVRNPLFFAAERRPLRQILSTLLAALVGALMARYALGWSVGDAVLGLGVFATVVTFVAAFVGTNVLGCPVCEQLAQTVIGTAPSPKGTRKLGRCRACGAEHVHEPSGATIPRDASELRGDRRWSAPTAPTEPAGTGVLALLTAVFFGLVVQNVSVATWAWASWLFGAAGACLAARFAIERPAEPMTCPKCGAVGTVSLHAHRRSNPPQSTGHCTSCDAVIRKSGGVLSVDGE